MRRYSKFILRHSGWIALVGTLIACVGAYYTVLLFKNMRTDLEELLPTTARSVVDLNEVTQRLESIDNLAVLVFSKNTEGSRRFVIDLVKELASAPKAVVSSVEYKIDRELQFFRERQALYMETSDLARIRDYIRDRIQYERELHNPLNIFQNANIPEPILDFGGLKQKYSQKLSVYDHFPGGFYATPDETKRVVLVYMSGKTSSINQVHRLKNTVLNAVEKLNPKSYASDLVVKYTGGVQDTLEEQEALMEDLVISTIIVVILVSIAMLAFYRSVRATAALLFSLFMGTFWTFGASYAAVGYLNANSAFLGSIVIGNGINFGIIFLARYLEERRRGHRNPRSVYLAIRHTYTPTWTAALAAGLSYGSLMLTGFRGFRQFGVIGLIGMVLCWISAYTLLPAYLTLIDRFSPLNNFKDRKSKSWLAAWIASLVTRFPRLIWGASILITLISLAALVTGNKSGILETNMGKLRNKDSIEHGSAYLSKYLDEIFRHYLSPLVLLPKNREGARQVAERLKEKKAEEGEKSYIVSVQTLDDFIPEDQPEKIKLLSEIRQLLPSRLVKRLPEADRKLISRFLTDSALKPVTLTNLPPLVLGKFTEKDKSIGKLVLIEPPLTRELWKGENLVRFIEEIRRETDAVAPGTPVAGTLAISSDMIKAVSHDGPRATAFALLAVVLLVIFLFRGLRTIGLVLFALFLGIFWMAGAVLGFDLKINFLNFIALPITFGIGVDYGVNIFQRYQQEKDKNIARVIRFTGGAVLLASLTTIIGYSSLLIARNQAFVSFGTLAVLGELTCVVAAVISLPAFLIYRENKLSPPSQSPRLPGGDSDPKDWSPPRTWSQAAPL